MKVYFVVYNGAVKGMYKRLSSCINLINRKGWTDDSWNSLYIVDECGNEYSSITGEKIVY